MAVLVARGFAANDLDLVIVITLYSALMTLVEMTSAVFSQNIPEWLFGGVGVLFVFLLLFVGYWWVLIVIMLVAIGCPQLSSFSKWMESRKNKQPKVIDDSWD